MLRIGVTKSHGPHGRLFVQGRGAPQAAKPNVHFVPYTPLTVSARVLLIFIFLSVLSLDTNRQLAKFPVTCDLDEECATR
jgi:hypothetical protein